MNPAPAAQRALDVLDLLARDPSTELSLSEIARRLSMPRATCQSVLLALVERGFLVRHDDAITYTLGPACVRVGDAAAHAAPLLHLAERAAAQLSRRIGLSTGVVARNGRNCTVVSAHQSGDPFTASLRDGQTLPLTAPFGAAWIAWADKRAIDRWLTYDPPLTKAERHRILDKLAAVRTRGYAVALTPSPHHATLAALINPEPRASVDRRRQRDARMRAVAAGDYLLAGPRPTGALQFSHMSAPVFSHTGAVEFVVMVLGPPRALDPAPLEQIGALLLEATGRISQAPPKARCVERERDVCA